MSITEQMGKTGLKEAEQKRPPWKYSSAASCTDRCPQSLSPSSPLQLPWVYHSQHGNIILGDKSRTGASAAVAIIPC